MKRFLTIALIIVFAGWWAIGVSPAFAAESESAAEFYKKNVVTMLVGFNPGGGSDYGGRILSSYWSTVTGGAMIVKNMTGGGGMLATNFMNSAKPNGLTIAFGNFQSAYLLPHLFNDRAKKFDMNKLNWLVGAFQEPFTILTSTKSPYESVDDLKKAKGLKFATLAPTDPGGLTEAFLIDLLGLDGRLITGYKGGSAMGLAAGKGEVDLIPNPLSVGLSSMDKGFVKKKGIVFDSKRYDILPGSPAITELAEFTPEQKKLFRMVYLASVAIRIGAAPPGVPEDRLEFMRDAFGKIVALNGFKRQAGLQFPLGPTAILGTDLQAFIDDSMELDINKIMTMVKKYMAIK